jgi:NAD(P)-dependent dehydrogenase (short-subunit alcohol dehydrogenase family)
MVARVLIIGGYGNFGSYIAKSLAPDPAIQLMIGGRSKQKAQTFAATLNAANTPEAHAIDITQPLTTPFAEIAPAITIHTTGPFQGQDYRVAKACIAQHSHYLDLADARHFVTNITQLNPEARAANVVVVSGASSVPCLSAAVIDHYRPAFAQLDSIDYGISAAQQTNRGLATTSAVLSYVGKPITRLRNGTMQTVHGWQDTHAVKYPAIGWRLFGNCEIPDLDLFPPRYPGLRNLRFAAGHELKILHAGTWALSWLVRAGLIPALETHAERLLQLTFLFDRFGTSQSGFHMFLSGQDHNKQPKQTRFYIIARSGHGPYIPCIPAILLAKRLAGNEHPAAGAMPCLDLITLEDYLAALKHLDISIQVDPRDA